MRTIKIRALKMFAAPALCAVISTGACMADISSVTGTGTTATTRSSTTTNFDGFGYFPTSIIGDTLTSSSSQIAFTYTPPPNYTLGDRLILQVTNDTGAAISNLAFTLFGSSSAPQYYEACTSCNPPYPAVPSKGVYNAGANTYTTSGDLTGDLNSGLTVLNVPVSIATGHEQDFYFAVNYTGAPGNFTLSQVATTSAGSSNVSATPEPAFYGALMLGLIGLAAVRKLRKA